MSFHGMDRYNHRDDCDDEGADEYYRGLKGLIDLIQAKPRIQEALKLFVTDEIHRYCGGEIHTTKPPRVYWNNHGTVISTDGAIYQLRTDDEGVPQVYVAPVDDRQSAMYCIRPYTYDSYSNEDGSEMRFDFVNGKYRSAPVNSLYDTEMQRIEGHDVTKPRHIEGADFYDGRDSVVIYRHDSGHVEGWVHNGKTRNVLPLYDARLVYETAKLALE